MVVITDKIRRAIIKTVETLGGQSEFSRCTGVAQQTISKYVSGAINKMGNRTWERLYPFVRDFLPPDVPVPMPGRPMLRSDFGAGSEAEPAPLDRLRMVPVLSFVQAAGYELALEPMCDYLRETSDESVPFIDVKDNYFALRISGDSMAPDYPGGTVVLVAAGEYPNPGDVVVAKIASTGQVVIKEFHRKDSVITLRSINPAGKSFEWNREDQPGFVQWMWPVVEVTLKLRDRRWAHSIKTNGSAQ